MAWAWVAAYTLLLYTTIPFARGWQLFLQNLFGQDFSVVINMLLAGVGLLTVGWFVRRMHGFHRWFFLSVVLLSMGSVSQIELPEERFHVVGYAVLGYLIARAATQSLTGVLFFITVLLVGFLIGLGDELIQGALPNRVFDWRDVAMNGAGVVVGLVVMRLRR